MAACQSACLLLCLPANLSVYQSAHQPDCTPVYLPHVMTIFLIHACYVPMSWQFFSSMFVICLMSWQFFSSMSVTCRMSWNFSHPCLLSASCHDSFSHPCLLSASCHDNFSHPCLLSAYFMITFLIHVCYLPMSWQFFSSMSVICLLFVSIQNICISLFVLIVVCLSACFHVYLHVCLSAASFRSM